MRLKTLELNGFKSFAHKTVLSFDTRVVAVVGPNGSGKSNVVEAIRFVLGEQSMKSMRGRAGADLIFKGSKSLSKGSRASVAIYLDNSDKIFKLINDSGDTVDLNFDTISIAREVYPDGVNKYLLNGSEVRLKDINNLLSSVNIGASGHHIISQGEADRILNANSKDRREMIEEALGLKIYQYKIKESERKLERTENNMKEVAMLRRENAPHLNFLRKQMDKIEKTKEMQNELLSLYKEYLKKESVYLDKEQSVLEKDKTRLSVELQKLTNEINTNERDSVAGGSKNIDELKNAERKINDIRNLKGEMSRKLGRIEGLIDGKERQVKISGRCPTCGNEIREIGEEQRINRQEAEKELAELRSSQSNLLSEIADLEKQESKLLETIELFKQEINKEMEGLRDKEREKFALKVRHQELSSALNLNNIKEQNLKREVEAFELEIKEGGALVGHEILYYKDFVFDGVVDRAFQEEQKRKIDRIKIKLEDSGATNAGEIKKEFDTVLTRDNFLAKELEDLEKSLASLEVLISDLKNRIDIEFKEGIKKINVEFDEFFKLMFGGGTGHLTVVVENKKKRKGEDDPGDGLEDDEEIEFQQGIEINVSLPHKKVKELHALSGGERSLTSIALLFAMSQVNPPPFLVLDETDAALDEANSRKYGDMIEKLSHHSQLVVVTHNRETMSRAGILYGVTVGADGASKLLSVKFDEAAAIAK